MIKSNKTTAILLVATGVILTGCQTTSSNTQWVQFAPGQTFEIADANCKIMAQTQQQGIYAQGTPGFVAGAQIGNAIGNAIRMQAFYNNCMVASGWKKDKVPVRRTGAVGVGSTRPS